MIQELVVCNPNHRDTCIKVKYPSTKVIESENNNNNNSKINKIKINLSMSLQLRNLLTFDDIRGVLLSSKHSGGKYLQIEKGKEECKRYFMKLNIGISRKH